MSTACEGYRVGSLEDGMLTDVRVHCPGCAETASLRERLTTAEAALLPRANDAADYKARMEAFHDLLETARADAAALREQLAALVAAEKYARDVATAWKEDCAQRSTALATAEALALTNGEAREKAEAALRDATRLADGALDAQAEVETRMFALRAERDELQGILARLGEALLAGNDWIAPDGSRMRHPTLIGGHLLSWLAAAIPEGTPAACPRCNGKRTVICDVKECRDPAWRQCTKPDRCVFACPACSAPTLPRALLMKCPNCGAVPGKTCDKEFKGQVCMVRIRAGGFAPDGTPGGTTP